MRVQRRVAAAVAIVALTAGCAGPDVGDVAQEGPTPSVAEGSTAEPSAVPTATAEPADRDERTVAIYSAVIRQVITRDHTFGDTDSPFRHISVVDRSFGRRGDFVDEQRPVGPPFNQQVRDGLGRTLADLPPLQFVTDAEDARTKDLRPQKKRGVILTLGAIEGDGDRVEVPNLMWCGGLCGQGLTYVVEFDHGEWEITGMTGPSMIS